MLYLLWHSNAQHKMHCKSGKWLRERHGHKNRTTKPTTNTVYQKPIFTKWMWFYAYEFTVRLNVGFGKNCNCMCRTHVARIILPLLIICEKLKNRTNPYLPWLLPLLSLVSLYHPSSTHKNWSIAKLCNVSSSHKVKYSRGQFIAIIKVVKVLSHSLSMTDMGLFCFWAFHK